MNRALPASSGCEATVPDRWACVLESGQPRELAAYHTMMLYREAVQEALEAMASDHQGPCCECRKQQERARAFLHLAQEVADVTAEIAGKR